MDTLSVPSQAQSPYVPNTGVRAINKIKDILMQFENDDDFLISERQTDMDGETARNYQQEHGGTMKTDKDNQDIS